MEEEQLMPCPWCGGPVEFKGKSYEVSDIWNLASIHCPRCGLTVTGRDEWMLRMRWNRREIKAAANRTNVHI